MVQAFGLTSAHLVEPLSKSSIDYQPRLISFPITNSRVPPTCNPSLTVHRGYSLRVDKAPSVQIYQPSARPI
jgi:hypothetical protein